MLMVHYKGKNKIHTPFQQYMRSRWRDCRGATVMEMLYQKYHL